MFFSDTREPRDTKPG